MSCSRCPGPSACGPLRYACNASPRHGLCGSDLNTHYRIETRRKPDVHEVVRMAIGTLRDGGYVYFCDRSSRTGVTVTRGTPGMFVISPSGETVTSAYLTQKLLSLLLAVCTDAISMCSHKGTVVYNKAEIDIQSEY